ncbi:MAG: DoxX family protein [Gammaproteobacteria bacterium]|nr:DoxX family protein [Gammaproteobacteria bacterium]
MGIINFINSIFDKLRALEFLAPLLLRLFLAPIMIYAGLSKLGDVTNTALWFEHSLGLPFPTLMVYLSGGAEFLGGIALLIGFAVRWFAIPLMITMVVAATTAHWDNGWHQFHEAKQTVPWEWKTDLIEEGNKRKTIVKDVLKKNANYKYLTEAGSITILKNGIEVSASYFIMLLALFFMGAGKYLSVDYYLSRFSGTRL